jgi:hypothetical protein
MKKKQVKKCFMCQGIVPKPKWIKLIASPRLVCSKVCLYHYSNGSDLV